METTNTTAAAAKTSITIQYEVTIARRGNLTTTVKEKTFRSEEALAKWADRPENQGNVTILRYLLN